MRLCSSAGGVIAAAFLLVERTRIETVKWAKAIKDAGIQPE